ncbi:MAG: toll/interleukin-1 receptor domain-containing protein [Hyphomicrobiaceae bacterium]
MPSEEEVSEVVDAIAGWRHWSGKYMLDALDVPNVERPDGGYPEYHRHRFRLADDHQMQQAQEFFQVGPFVQHQSCWTAPGLRLFVSHVAAAVETVMPLQAALLERGVSSFLAHDEIEDGEIWRDVLLDALAQMHALLAFHSNGFYASSWCGQEVGYALGRGVQVVSVNDGEDPPGFLQAVQGRRWNPDFASEVADRVVARLQRDETNREALGEEFARRLKFSGTYDRSEACTARLRELRPLSALAKRSVELGSNLNDQVPGIEHLRDLLND